MLIAAVSLVVLGLAAEPAPPSSEDRAARQASIDRTAVRFLAPEIGGADHPLYITERTLAFETRLEAMTDPGSPAGEPYPERQVRSAMEHDVAEQMLASLGQKLIDDSPADKRPVQSEIDGVLQDVTAAIIERLGGRARIDTAAAAEHLGEEEVDALIHRGAFATWYLDRIITPILHPTEEQLREVYRAANHPYRGQRFEQVHDQLEHWFVVDRVRAAEGAFLQAARSHVKIMVTP